MPPTEALVLSPPQTVTTVKPAERYSRALSIPAHSVESPLNREASTPYDLRRQFAKDAVSAIFRDLWNDGVNSVNYHSSPAYIESRGWVESHGHAVVDTIVTGLETFSTNNFPHDIHRLEALENTHQLDQSGKPVAKMFEAQDIAYAGIKLSVEQAAQHHSWQEGEDITVSNIHAIDAIAATVIRMHYLRLLSDKRPDVIDEGKRRSFDAMFTSNILDIVRNASLIEHALTKKEPYLADHRSMPRPSSELDQAAA